MKGHLLRAHGQREIKIKREHDCLRCSKQLGDLGELHTHIARKHIACAVCNVCFHEREALVNHWQNTGHLEHCVTG